MTRQDQTGQQNRSRPASPAQAWPDQTGQGVHTDLNLVVAVVMEVEMPEEFGVSVDHQFLAVVAAVSCCLARILLHLDVEELPGTQMIHVLH